MDFQELITTYETAQAGVCFASGMITGGIIRLYQNYIIPINPKGTERWRPFGSLGLGSAMAGITHSGLEMYAIDTAAALAGDFVIAKIIDKLPRKRATSSEM